MTISCVHTIRHTIRVLRYATCERWSSCIENQRKFCLTKTGRDAADEPMSCIILKHAHKTQNSPPTSLRTTDAAPIRWHTLVRYGYLAWPVSHCDTYHVHVWGFRFRASVESSALGDEPLLLSRGVQWTTDPSETNIPESLTLAVLILVVCRRTWSNWQLETNRWRSSSVIWRPQRQEEALLVTGILSPSSSSMSLRKEKVVMVFTRSLHRQWKSLNEFAFLRLESNSRCTSDC